MGFYGMTWNIMPLGGFLAGATAGLVGLPFVIAAGGLLVSGFALGPALLNKNIRTIGSLLSERESAMAARPTQTGQRTGAAAGDD
jgi:hypothetical protein